MRNTPGLLSAACGLALLSAAPAVASTLPPTASLFSEGTLSFSSASGLTLAGDLTAEYRTPSGGPKPYIFSKSIDLGPLTATPSFTVKTPELLLGQICIIRCRDVFLPSFTLDLNPTIPLLPVTNVFDGAITSPALPLGALFGFDYGTPLLGVPLTFGEVVQDQFETGATTVSVAGVVGPFGGSFDYDGELQPGGEVILADYTLNLTGPGLLAEVEAFALGLLNDNTDLLFDVAFDALLASNPCASFGPLAGSCNSLIGGLGASDVQITVTSLGTLSGGYAISKTITPVPVPLSLPLLASGLAVMGLVGVRRRKTQAA